MIEIDGELRQTLEQHGQSHVLRYWEQLDDSQRKQLSNQVATIDFDRLDRLCRTQCDGPDFAKLAARAQSPPAFRYQDPSNRISPGEARRAGEERLRNGQVGALLVAGGQGTRLGFPHPKGMFEIGPVSGRTLFQMHVDQLLARAHQFETRIPLYLMTSPATHDETVQFLAANDRFGLSEDDLHIFCQGTMPAVDEDGKLLLSDRGAIAMSPDGHGGMLAAFDSSGCLKKATDAGIRQLFYFQVDNPLAPICDPELIGYHCLAESETSTLVVRKKDPLEKVGNVVSVDDRLMVIEYSDLPEEAAHRVDSQGELQLWAGSIAVHVIDVEFLRRLVGVESALPFHRAHKKVAFVDASGVRIEPEQANAIKFERFIFDLIPHAANGIVIEADESQVFAPLKNASGAPKDTPESTRAAIVAQAKQWLTTAGVSVPDHIQVELDPKFALDADAKQRVGEIDLSTDVFLN